MKKKNLKRGSLLSLLILCSPLIIMATNIKGVVIDKNTKEPLIGAAVRIAGTTIGAVTNFEGHYILPHCKAGTYTLEVRYVGYQSQIFKNLAVKGEAPFILNIELVSETVQLEGAVVVARKNMAAVKILKAERKLSTTAVENMGAKEMGLKGISNVKDGVKKMTGISFERGGQIVVRGLGDRYSATTLNGLPIASPNPDNKLIPLDLFPTSTIQNITVSKVYSASKYADYSGAHINIATRENIGKDYLSVSFNLGGQLNTVMKNLYTSNKPSLGMLKTNNISESIKKLSTSFQDNQWNKYIRSNDPFKTTFSIKERKALPNFGASLSFGKTWNLKNNHKINFIFSGTAKNSSAIQEDAYVARLKANGEALNEFNYNNYTQKLDLAALASLGYHFNTTNRIQYTLFYARNAVDNYKRREGQDAEQLQLVGSNSTYHVYTLLNNQLAGHHQLNDKLLLDWKGSYGTTSSDEPDRRQVMFRRLDDGKLHFFSFNSGTMRYFGELQEKETVGDVKMTYLLKDKHKIKWGASYKKKNRDYTSIAFFYDMNNYRGVAFEDDEIYHVDAYLNPQKIANGTVKVTKYYQPYQSYKAGTEIIAGFAETDYYLNSHFLINFGVRYEHVKQWVNYANDGGTKLRSEIAANDFFPSLNLKYNWNPRNVIRLSMSRTITRPSFIEMAPFLYSESYGSAEIRGNAELKNAYNYNLDLRYEFFPEKSDDLFSITGYFKYLDKPIEQVQEYTGGSPQHTFYNAESGMAAGVEVEYRKTINCHWQVGINGSYMYTNVDLPTDGGGNYTASERRLQGASPYLGNVDLLYSKRFEASENQLNIAFVYNLQGPRISSVGTNGAGDVIQQPIHTLNFVGNYKLKNHWGFKVEVKNLLNSTLKFKQDLLDSNLKKIGKVDSEYFKNGTTVSIGISYKF